MARLKKSMETRNCLSVLIAHFQHYVIQTMDALFRHKYIMLTNDVAEKGYPEYFDTNV